MSSACGIRFRGRGFYFESSLYFEPDSGTFARDRIRFGSVTVNDSFDIDFEETP